MSTREPRFERVRLIGKGATGRVDLARLTEPFGDLPIGHEVAIKTLDPECCDDECARAAFEAESSASRRARDPSLVHVLHHSYEKSPQGTGRPYLMLQYVPGRSLEDALAEGALPEPLVRSVGAQLAGALAALHTAGLVHGDVKPENVRIDESGRAVLLDLGFARRILDESAGRGMGSLAYLSPERARGQPTSPAADVFGLGVVLYELATGLHPFGHTRGGGDSTRPASGDVAEAWAGMGHDSGELLRRTIEAPGADELLAAIATTNVVAPSHLDLTLSPFLDELLAEALARAPEDRPSAGELRERLHDSESGSWWRAVVERDRAATQLHGRRPGKHLSSLVGRRDELAQLGALLARARSGSTTVAWVSGPAGCGKWRVVSEFATRARTSFNPPIYLYTRWNEISESYPAGALLILLHRWLRLPPGAEPKEREKRLLTDLLGPRKAETLLTAVAPTTAGRTARESVPAALAAWLQAIGRERPILVFLDDLHLAGPVTLDALSAFFDALDEVPALVLLGVRDDVGGVDPGLERLRVRLERTAEAREAFEVGAIQLKPLDQAAIRELVDELFDRSVPRGRLAEVLWLRSRGNPGLVTEILRELIADGRARVAPGGDETRSDSGGNLVLTIAPDELPLPRSLGRMVSERFQALDDDDRRWLGRLAVVGGRIAPDFLTRTFPPTGRAEIDEVLARLVRSGWLVPVANRYRFARPALREAVYRSLSDSRRRRLHFAAARGLGSHTRGTDPESSQRGEAPTVGADEVFQRAFHLRAAGEHDELLELVLFFVRTEGRRASARRLLTLARWGLEAIEESETDDVADDNDRLELLETATDAADRLGRRDEERELLDYMIDLDLDLEREPAHGARLYMLHARYATGTGSFGLARGMLRNAIHLAESSGNPALVSQSARLMAQIQAQIGEFDDARSFATTALEAAQDTNQVGLAHLALAHVDVLEDALEDALHAVERAVRELRRGDEVRLGVASYANLIRARIWRSIGRPGRALGSARRAVELARRAGERRLEAEARARLGGLLLDLNRPDDAETELRDAELLADEIQDRRGLVLTRTWLGLLMLEEDDREARATIERATRLASEIGFYRAESFGLAILARAYRRDDDLKRADRFSTKGLELVERHGAELTDRITITGTRALVLRERRQTGPADALIKELERRIERGVKRFVDPILRREHRSYTRLLLATALSSDGPCLPRVS